jgi:hypothetical protein
MIAELQKGSFQDAHFCKAYDSAPIAISFYFISSFSIKIFNKKNLKLKICSAVSNGGK